MVSIAITWPLNGDIQRRLGGLVIFTGKDSDPKALVWKLLRSKDYWKSQARKLLGPC